MLDIFEMMEGIKRRRPFIYQIANFVSANDCANAVLALSATTVMSQAPEELEEILIHADSLVLNLGIPSADKIKTIIKAGIIANKLGIPVVLDPVGCGSTMFRKQAVEKILQMVRVSVIRGNFSEILFLSNRQTDFTGVDSGATDNQDVFIKTKEMAQRFHCVVVATGEKDIITDGKRTYICSNGCPEMSALTGTGCICSALIGTFISDKSGTLLESTAGAVAFMGISGECAWEENMNAGYGHFHMGLFDWFSRMRKEVILERSRLYEVI